MPRQSLSDAEVDQLITLVRGGAPLEAAVVHLGREPARFFRWLQLPRQNALRQQIYRAGAQANLADLGIIQSASQDDWQAARVRLQLRQASEREQDLHRLNAIALGGR